MEVERLILLDNQETMSVLKQQNIYFRKMTKTISLIAKHFYMQKKYISVKFNYIFSLVSSLIIKVKYILR